MRANPRELKRRVGAARKVLQETAALQRIAAERLLRSRSLADAQREYSERLSGACAALQGIGRIARHPLFGLPADQPVCLVACGADRGLCGAYNATITAEILRSVHAQQPRPPILLVVGQAIQDQLRRLDIAPDHVVPQPPLRSHDEALRELAAVAFTFVTEKRCAAVDVLYAHDTRSLHLEVRVERLFPWVPAPVPCDLARCTFEPDVDELLPRLAREFLRAALERAFLHGLAAEQAARHLTMSRAVENTKQMIAELLLRYHRARQDAITIEMAEFAAGGVRAC